jgi:hypothetical protein
MQLLISRMRQALGPISQQYSRTVKASAVEVVKQLQNGVSLHFKHTKTFISFMTTWSTLILFLIQPYTITD